MIYPIDVNKRVIEQRTISGNNKIQLFLTLFVIANVVLFFILSSVYSIVFGWGLGPVIVTQVILSSVAGITVFRFVVFDENSKRLEWYSGENDSFARYMYVRKDVQRNVPIGNNGEIGTVFEFTNGCSMAIVEVLFGNNDKSKANQTKDFLQQFTKEVLKFGFMLQTVVLPENFYNSKEYRKHIASVNRTCSANAEKNKAIINLTNNIMEQAANDSNVNAVYFLIRTQTNYQVDELKALMRRLNVMQRESFSAIRLFHFLDTDGFFELGREFYTVAAIDLSLMKAMHTVSNGNENRQSMVHTYSVKGSNDRVYSRVKNQRELLNYKE